MIREMPAHFLDWHVMQTGPVQNVRAASAPVRPEYNPTRLYFPYAEDNLNCAHKPRAMAGNMNNRCSMLKIIVL